MGLERIFLARKKLFFLNLHFPLSQRVFVQNTSEMVRLKALDEFFQKKKHIVFSINHCKPPINRYKPPYEQNYRKNSLKQGCTYMLVYSHDMLVYACTFQNRKIWVLGFLTHYFRCILDKNSSKTANLKFFQIFIF